MNPKFLLNQLLILSSLFLIVNFLFFLPSYYSFNVDPARCDKLEASKLEFSYQENLCGSVLKAWKSFLLQREEFKSKAIPLIIALLITSIYSYYEKLEERYRRLGI
ncbi:MAG: hypothetical protein ABEJ56_04375 [Candidatus Nanohaloarchaea archaeon]